MSRKQVRQLSYDSSSATDYDIIRFIVRDFEFSEDLIEKQKEEIVAADSTEKELWVCDCAFSPLASVDTTQ